MRRPLFAILCLLLLGLSIGSLAAQTSEPPPYLYYYSRMLGGLIIERADGTDSRHIAADVIPPKLAAFSGPGWSPSGRYFAAFNTTAPQYGVEVMRPLVIDASGKSLFPWFGSIGRIFLMQWSPTGEDILLIVGDYNGYRSPAFGTTFWLIDVANETLLVDFVANLSDISTSLNGIHWDVSQQRLQFHIAPETYEGRDNYRVTIQFDGTTLREPITEAEFMAASDTNPFHEDLSYFDDVAVSPSGRYSLSGGGPTIMTETGTGKTVELPNHSQATRCSDYLWTEDEQYIVTLTGTVIAGGGCGVAMMGVTDNEGNLWRELGWCLWSAPACAGWLPDQIDLDVFPTGSSEPLQLDPVRFEAEEEGVFGIGVLGLPFSRLLCNEQDSAYIIENSQTRYWLITDICLVNKDAVFLREDGVQIVTAYDPVHDLLATYSEDISLHAGFVTLWRRSPGHYEPVYEPLFQLNSYGFELQFTDSGQYLRARNIHAWKVYAVSDILERIEQSNETQ